MERRQRLQNKRENDGIVVRQKMFADAVVVLRFLHGRRMAVHRLDRDTRASTKADNGSQERDHDGNARNGFHVSIIPLIYRVNRPAGKVAAMS